METSSTSASELRSDTRWQRIALVWQRCQSRADILWLALITLVAAWCRLSFLAAPIRYDEAFTFLTFVLRGIGQLFDYPYPSNHILHTLSVRAVTDPFGHEPCMIC